MKRILYTLFFISIFSNCLFAQQLTTTVSSNKVAVGEIFQIQFSVDGNASNFKLPALAEFDIYQGPFQSNSTSVVNGVVTQSSSLTYALVAKKEGKHTIGPATVIANGKTIQSNSVTVEVTKGRANSGNQSSASSGQGSGSQTNQGNRDDIFLRASVNKTKAYVGEVIDATFKIYSRIQIEKLANYTRSSFNGFFVQEVKGNQQFKQYKETIDGVQYLVIELSNSFLIPQHTGKITISPTEVECVVLQKSNRRPRDIFDQIFGGGYEEAVVKLKSSPVTIDVIALPETGKPENFSGAVGNYSYKAVLSKDKVKANDAVNLTLTLSGKGNIKLIEPLKVGFPEDFETYDPKVNENISVTDAGISGTKSFDYLVIPRHEGEYKIEQVNFSYFDPVKKEYITIPSPEFTLHVDKGDGTAATVVGGTTNSKSDLKVLGNDIRYIKTSTSLIEKSDYFFGSPLFYTLLISPLLGFLAFIFIRRKNIELNRDGIAVKSRKATKMARKRLFIAEKHLKSDYKEQFYIEIFKSLYGYIGDKLNIPVAELNKEHISDKLKSRSVSAPTILQLIDTLDNCEYARYAPSAVSGDLKGIFLNTVELITKIEDEIV